MESNLLVDIIGWIGAAQVLAAYFLISANKVTGNSLLYQLLNIFGAACLIVLTGYYGAYPSVLVNVIWVFIGIYALRKVARTGSVSLFRKNKEN